MKSGRCLPWSRDSTPAKPHDVELPDMSRKVVNISCPAFSPRPWREMKKHRNYDQIYIPVIFFLCLLALLMSGISTRVYAATSAEIKEWLQAHNAYRTLHGAPKVTWSSDLAQRARNWADSCPSGHSRSPYGENMAFATYEMSVGNVVARWYREESRYNYANSGYQAGTGHFTQVVWKNTAQIGCAHATRCTGTWSDIWVCLYNPPGNIKGKFAANVFPAGKPAAHSSESSF
jgi:pathogenesis-related protein 1